ncbi:hypothetical protein [Lysinibacillus sp. 54212]|uniref:hypothetical protein n=1 Tax=Lysinibacillus sp. 54212 TaxID=3119829 RepID=UPI002FC72470
MNDEKWDELDIEKLLEQAPKIQDNRSKEDVFAKLQQAGAFEEEHPPVSVVKRKNHALIILGISAALFVVLFSGAYFLSPQTSNDKMAGQSENTLSDSSAERKVEVAEDDGASSGVALEQDESRGIRALNNMDLRTSVYQEQLSVYTAIHLGLVGKNGESVPVTVVIPNEQIIEEFGHESPSAVDLYSKYAASLNEQALGFTELHPLQGKIEEQGSTLIYTLPEDHQYNDKVSSDWDVLLDTFGNSYERVVLHNEPSAGKEEQANTTMSLSKRGSYFLYGQGNDRIYLAPHSNHSFNSAKEALEYMKIVENDQYQTAILQGVDYSVVEEGDKAVVTFSTPLDLNDFDPQQAMRMLEGMLLTAGGFNKQVQFSNIVQQQWEGFNFSSPLPIPVGANTISLEQLESY